MATITLLTDFGHRDVYVGVMKGVINQISPEAAVIDLCHEIPAQDVRTAGYMLAASFQYFKEGSIHVAVVDPGVGSERRAIAARAAGHVFVLPDNGLISFVAAGHRLDQVVSLKNDAYFRKPVSRTFHGRDVFAPVAAHLSLGVSLRALGPAIADPIIEAVPQPRRENGKLLGEVIHVDRFGNLVTNISESDVANLPEVGVRIGFAEIAGLRQSYAEAGPGELLVIIGSFGNLEISVACGNAAEALGVGVGAAVEIHSR